MHRPGYREALEWLAFNDDNTWLPEADEENYTCLISVAGALVCDLWQKPREIFFRDLQRVINRVER